MGCIFTTKILDPVTWRKSLGIAAVLQYFTTNESEINDNTMMLAIKLVDYYTMQYISLFKHETELPEAVKNAETLYRWLSGKNLLSTV